MREKSTAAQQSEDSLVRPVDLMVMETAKWVNGMAPWENFATLTFEWEASLASAQRCFERFMKKLPEVSYFYGIEQNPSRDGHHVHALWANCETLVRSKVWEKWFQQYGRARIEPIKGIGDVVDYCAKYACKEIQQGWWNVELKGDLWTASRRALTRVTA